MHMITKPLSIALLLILFAGCSQKNEVQFKFEKDAGLRALLDGAHAPYPAADFAVISDAHLYDRSLGTSGEAFAAYLADDRKLLVESEEILSAAVERIISEAPKFVLVCGDATKDGELVCHRLFASYMERIEQRGIAVYLIPGNHDINNPHAVRYLGEKSERVENVTPGDYARIYDAYGFGEAIIRDKSSLAYVAEPVPGLWLLCLDSCRYERNEADNYPRISGEFGPERLAWIEEVLIRAAKEGKAVIALSHHGLMEHYRTQRRYYGEYVVDDYRRASRLLAAYHVRVVFTGHFHAQDITMMRFQDGAALYDVETGALVTHPSPYRMVTIDDAQQMRIETLYIDAIASRPEGFSDYAHKYVMEGIGVMAADKLRSYKVRGDDIAKLAPQIAKAFVTHYEGDEIVSPDAELLDVKGSGIMARIVAWNRRPLIEGLWHDLEPADNNLTIDLSSGEVR